MVAALLDAGDLDPTVINGGIINAYGTSAAEAGGGWWWKPTKRRHVLKLPADVAIVTNVDPGIDHFKTFDAVQDAFRNFVENVPFYGFAVMCMTILCADHRRQDRGPPHHHYGENPQADARLLDRADGRQFQVAFGDRKADTAHEIADLVLPMPAQRAQCDRRDRGGA
jgi:UDP-N-acetylmuramate--alanine ligase